MDARLKLMSARLFVIPLYFTLVFAASPSLAERTQLYLPELAENRFPGTREETFNYYKFDYSVPLAYQEQQSFFLPSGRPAPMLGGSAPHWFRKTLFPVTSPLFEPGRDPYESNLMKGLWWESSGSRVPQHTADHINEALRDAPPILLCVYHRQAHIVPVSFRQSMTGLHTGRVILAFWAQEPPSELAPVNLREFDGSEPGISPIILIGPHIEACPENLGAALETLASNAPDLVPATDPSFKEATQQAFSGRP